MKARVGPIYGSGGFLSDVFFFQVGGPLTAGLISGRGAYWKGSGGGVGLLSHVLFSR